MNTIWKTGLLTGVSLSLVMGFAHADDADTTQDTRQLDTVIVLGQQQT